MRWVGDWALERTVEALARVRIGVGRAGKEFGADCSLSFFVLLIFSFSFSVNTSGLIPEGCMRVVGWVTLVTSCKGIGGLFGWN